MTFKRRALKHRLSLTPGHDTNKSISGFNSYHKVEVDDRGGREEEDHK